MVRLLVPALSGSSLNTCSPASRTPFWLKSIQPLSTPSPELTTVTGTPVWPASRLAGKLTPFSSSAPPA